MTATSAYPVSVDASLDPHLSVGCGSEVDSDHSHVVVLIFLWIAFFSRPSWPSSRSCSPRIPAGHLRVQRRRAAVGVASQLLRLQRPGHRQIPAVHAADDPTSRRTSPCPTRAPLPGLVLVKWWLLALPHLIIVASWSAGARVRLELRHAELQLDRQRTGRAAGLHRRHHPGRHRQLSPRPLRPHPRPGRWCCGSSPTHR